MLCLRPPLVDVGQASPLHPLWVRPPAAAMSTVEIRRTNNTTISVETSAATGSRITLDHFMWAARELQEAIDAGMTMDTEVKIRNENGVNGVSISARCVLVQEIP